MDNPKNTPVILSLCTGSRGLERGIEDATGTQLTVATYVEIEAFVNYNLVAAMEQGILAPAPIYTNLKTFDASPFRNRIHGLIGGYPCQPFSNAGLRKGTEDPRHLYPYIERIIHTANPIWCYFENVEGHLNLGFSEVQASLHRLGYAVEADLYTASEVGATHRRARLFILAIRKDVLEYAHHTRNSTVDKRRQFLTLLGFGRSGNELGNSESRYQQRLREFRKVKPKEIRRHGTSEKLAHAPCLRFGKNSIEHQPKQFSKNETQWPARPGQPQHEWEEPRTTKPGMGCTVNGYNFTTDLLRLYGNGVVYQQAAHAFNSLIDKHLTIH